MDQTSIDAFTDAVRHDLLAWLGIAPSSVSALGGFESFLFAREDRGTILRFTHVAHRELPQVFGELEWIEHLARHGASVCRPIPLLRGELAAQRDEFIACEFERARGRLITESDWRPALFREWGRAIGQFHRLATSFEPANASHRRVDWMQDPNFDFRARIPPSQTRVLEQADRYLAKLRTMPREARTYGLLHGDAHPGNYRYDGERLAFFDFDDACYCWFAYDVATILFSAVLQPWIENTRAAQEAAAAAFLPPFLDGYGSEFEVSGLLLEHLGLFLKVRELSLYAVIHAFLDVADLRNPYEAKFMQERQQRIEMDEPYLDMAFP